MQEWLWKIERDWLRRKHMSNPRLQYFCQVNRMITRDEFDIARVRQHLFPRKLQRFFPAYLHWLSFRNESNDTDELRWPHIGSPSNQLHVVVEGIERFSSGGVNVQEQTMVAACMRADQRRIDWRPTSEIDAISPKTNAHSESFCHRNKLDSNEIERENRI